MITHSRLTISMNWARRKKQIEVEGRTIDVFEVRPIEVRTHYLEMCEGLDGLTEKQRLDAVADRVNTYIYLLFKFVFKEQIETLSVDDMTELYRLWYSVNTPFFTPPEEVKQAAAIKAKKKYIREEDFRRYAKNIFSNVCLLIESGHSKADFYSWSEFTAACEYTKQAQKRRINELATAICCAFDKKTWEKVNKE